MYFRPFRLLKLFIPFICVILLIYELYPLLIRPRKERLSITKDIDIPMIFKSEGNVEEKSYNLEPFYISLPNFSDDEARNWFYSFVVL